MMREKVLLDSHLFHHHRRYVYGKVLHGAEHSREADSGSPADHRRLWTCLAYDGGRV